MYVSSLIQATQSTNLCTWSSQTGMAMARGRRVIESELEDLPNCTWEEYCSRHEIQSPLKAKTLLLTLEVSWEVKEKRRGGSPSDV